MYTGYLVHLNAGIVQCYLFFRPPPPHHPPIKALPFLIFLVILPCGLFPLKKNTKKKTNTSDMCHTQDKCEMEISGAD